MRIRMGASGREIVVSEFSSVLAVRETLEVYRALLSGRWSFPVATVPS
jgi:hypothetical protein